MPRPNDVIAGEITIPVIVSMDPKREKGNFMQMSYVDCGMKIIEENESKNEKGYLYACIGGNYTIKIEGDERTFAVRSTDVWNAFCDMLNKQDYKLEVK